MPYTHRGTPTGDNHRPSYRPTPKGYGDYSNPETRDQQRATDREFDKMEWDEKYKTTHNN